MQAEKTKNRREDTESTAFGSTPMGNGIFGIMKKCCTGQDGFPDCSTMMKGMMEAMKKQPCCMPKKDAAESEGRKK
jgi:hypothetical protein